MKKIAIAMAVLMVALITAPNLLAQGQQVSTIISIDQVSGNPGDHVAIPIRMSNNSVEISAMTIPLKFQPGQFTVDSISTVGAIQIDNIGVNHYFSNDSGTINILYIADFINPVPSFLVSSALLATIHVTINDYSSPGLKVIDSVNFLSDVYWSGLNMSDGQGLVTYVPNFESGGVVVLVPTGIDDENGAGTIPTAFNLGQNYPNPFNPTTTIEYALPTAGRVQIEVFNVLGQSVAMLVDDQMTAGIHQVEFDASSQPSGMFFYRITNEEGSLTKKMVLVK